MSRKQRSTPLPDDYKPQVDPRHRLSKAPKIPVPEIIEPVEEFDDEETPNDE